MMKTKVSEWIWEILILYYIYCILYRYYAILFVFVFTFNCMWLCEILVEIYVNSLQMGTIKFSYHIKPQGELKKWKTNKRGCHDLENTVTCLQLNSSKLMVNDNYNLKRFSASFWYYFNNSREMLHCLNKVGEGGGRLESAREMMLRMTLTPLKMTLMSITPITPSKLGIARYMNNW